MTRHDGDEHPRLRFALTADGSAQPGGGTTAEQSDVPRAPRNVTVKIGDGKLTLDWEPVPDALFYNIYYKTPEASPRKARNSTGSNTMPSARNGSRPRSG